MRSIPLSAIYSSAKNRKPGYVEEVIKKGKVSGSSVLLSEEDFNLISRNFALNSSFEPVKVEQKKIEQKVFIGNLTEKKSEPVKVQVVEPSGKLLDVEHYHLDNK